MMARPTKFVLAAVLAAAIPAAAVLAQTQDRPPPRPTGPSPETLARLQDGRIAMIKESLKLNEAQLKVWAPVEAQMRASFAAREQTRAERRQNREKNREKSRERLSLPDRLDRTSQRMAQRAERTKAFAEAFRPFYDSLTDEQKAVAGVVLRQARDRGFRERRGRWAMHREPRAERN
jgi:Spy/CpxP family protein refolding chaperone